MLSLLNISAFKADTLLIPGLSQEIIMKALNAYNIALKSRITNKKILTIVDYTQPSYSNRLWVIDVAKKQVLHNELVAHGKGSGIILATKFSNIPGSLTSSIGVFLTGQPYHGKHGKSLILYGIDGKTNNLAHKRNIVMHGSEYVNKEYVNKHGRIGRSHGCLAIDKKIVTEIINKLAGGTIIFSYFPEDSWLNESNFL